MGVISMSANITSFALFLALCALHSRHTLSQPQKAETKKRKRRQPFFKPTQGTLPTSNPMPTTSTSLFRSSNQNATVSATPNYSEVFGSRLHGDGIPVLKLPDVDLEAEKELHFHLGLVDYDEVFGGYDDWSFEAASYKDVFGESTCWTQLEASLHQEEAYHCNFSSENGQRFSDIERRSNFSDLQENLANFTHAHHVVNESSHFNGSDSLGSNIHGSNCTEERDVERMDSMHPKGLQFKEAVLTLSGIGLRTQPPKCPPPSRRPPIFSDQNDSLTELPIKSRNGGTRRYSFQGTADSSTFYDVEVDTISADAASAAAMLDAMEKAQTTFYCGNEIMDWQKEGLSCRLKPSQKKCSTEVDIAGLNKLVENLGENVAAEGKKLLVGDRYMTDTGTTKTSSQSMKDMKQKNAIQKSITKRERHVTWSCGDFDQSIRVIEDDETNFVSGKLEEDERIRLADIGQCETREPAEDVVDCNGDREVLCFEVEPSSKQIITKRQLARVCRSMKMACERTIKEEPTYKNESSSSDDHKELDGADSCDENDISMEVLQDASYTDINVQVKQESQNDIIVNKRTLIDGRVKEHNKMSYEKSSAIEDDKEKKVEMADNQGEHQKMKIGFEPEEDCIIRLRCNLKGLSLACDPFDNDKSLKGASGVNFNIDGLGAFSKWQGHEHFSLSHNAGELEKPHSDDRYIDKITEVVKPLNSLYNLGEKVDLNAGIVRSYVDTEVKPRQRVDTLKIETIEKNVVESVPISGDMRSYTRELPKMVDIAMEDLPKNTPKTSTSFLNHPLDEEAIDLMLKTSEEMQHWHLKKMEKERYTEREKDFLVVNKSLLEVHKKPRNDAFQRVEKAAVESDNVKPYEFPAYSSQRRKARFERERRTAERAARALAEKNMRDLEAQKEQAEKIRLADSLGAEVKRWAMGKEGNLRALLSTLQYVLGPDSDWKPIPLADVITPVAVKKAYRKATLYVHPDKVQQRGANIQQKFICEKIFYLLKDAWNKFNSEAC